MKPMGPIIPSTRHIIDDIIKNLPNIAFDDLVSDSLLHINENSPSFELIDLRPNRERGILISIPKKRTHGIIVFPGFIIFGVLFKKQLPKLPSCLIATLPDLNGYDFSWH